MDSIRPKDTKNLLSLTQAANKLGVTTEVLLNLNEFNILKPTITLTGEIGYTDEQIENFLKIQKSSGQNSPAISNNINPSGNNLSVSYKSDQANNSSYGRPQISNSFYRERPANIHSKNTATHYPPKSNNRKLLPFLAVSSLSFLFFSTLFFITAGAEIHSSTNVLSSSGLPTANASTQTQNSLTQSDNNLSSGSANALDEKIVLRDVIFEEKNTDSLPDANQEMPLPDKNQSIDSEKGSNNLTGFASRTNCPSCIDNEKNEASIFDEKGNLKGEPKGSDLLATAPIGQTRIEIADRSSADIVLLAFLGLGFLSMMFIFRSQFAYLGDRNRKSDSDSLAPPTPQKILEVTQKTDGSVVFYFLGTEYKVSKPELDSESDQFISRLMELVQEDAKEIDYDVQSDEKIQLNTPLSKLVTRLGFVGIKRDLFFPRTSKNRVLFRRYVTEQDLISMSLKPEQIPLSLQ